MLAFGWGTANPACMFVASRSSVAPTHATIRRGANLLRDATNMHAGSPCPAKASNPAAGGARARFSISATQRAVRALRGPSTVLRQPPEQIELVIRSYRCHVGEPMDMAKNAAMAPMSQASASLQPCSRTMA